jgi:hypothetical protein
VHQLQLPNPELANAINRLLEPKDFPTQAEVTSPDNYMNQVMTDPGFLGPTSEANHVDTRYVRLTTLDMKDAGRLQHQVPNMVDEWEQLFRELHSHFSSFERDGRANEIYTVDTLGLPKLPTGFA